MSTNVSTSSTDAFHVEDEPVDVGDEIVGGDLHRDGDDRWLRW
jgi:hypothetical protein